MTQDTRKDKRAKVVSLNVRYKSATVDEFIENHSHDVSKGGIFVKTPSPFPPGTLLKFEIRLAGDKSVISGVGRVVWKREPTGASGDKPAGMGVKFIKLDDASRAVIDKLVTQKSDAGSAYTSDPAALSDDDDGKPPTSPTTLRGLVAANPNAGPPIPAGLSPSISPSVSVPPPSKSPAQLAPKPAPAPAPKPAGPAASPPGAPRARPATVIGIAPPAPAAAPAPVAAAPAPAPAAAKSEPRPGAPPPAAAAAAKNPRKMTMMGVGLPAGGSAPGAEKHELPTLNQDIPALGEVHESNDLTRAIRADAIGKAAAAADKAVTGAAMFPATDKNAPQEAVSDPTMMKQAAELLEEALREAGGSLDEIGQNPLFAQGSQRGNKVEESKTTKSAESPAAPAVAKAAPQVALPIKTEPQKPLLSTVAPDEKKKGGMGVAIAVVLVAVAATGAGALYLTKSPATPETPTATTATAAPPPTASSSANVAASASASAAPIASASAAPAAVTDAGAAASSASAAASAAPPIAVTPATPAVPPPAPKAVAAPPVVRAPVAPRPRPPMPAPTATDPDLQTAPPEPKTAPTEEKPKEAPAPKDTATAAPSPAPSPPKEAPAPAPTPEN